ncbi:MAG: hypothetical protein HYV26_10970, partial [Candidatus Hydrogenedentes bacterium]|nr:hypothetical protein [Candidatus Hydrogenedentota bacterium]
MRRSAALLVASVVFAGVFLSGCPASTKVRVDFVGAPRVGFAALTVQFQGTVAALPGYVLSQRYRGEA